MDNDTMVAVTQADRDAARAFWRQHMAAAPSEDLEVAFARHRHQSETGAALTSEAREADVERVAVAIRDVKQGLGFDYIDFCRDAARAAIAALAQPVEAGEDGT